MEEHRIDGTRPAPGDVIFMPEIRFVGVKPGYYVLLSNGENEEDDEDHVTLGFVDILADGIAPTGRTINIPRDALTRFNATSHHLDMNLIPLISSPAIRADQE